MPSRYDRLRADPGAPLADRRSRAHFRRLQSWGEAVAADLTQIGEAPFHTHDVVGQWAQCVRRVAEMTDDGL